MDKEILWGVGGDGVPRRVSTSAAPPAGEGRGAGLAFDPSGPGRGERFRGIAEGGP